MVRPRVASLFLVDGDFFYVFFPSHKCATNYPTSPDTSGRFSAPLSFFAQLFVIMGFSAAHRLHSWLQSLPKPELPHPTSARRSVVPWPGAGLQFPSLANLSPTWPQTTAPHATSPSHSSATAPSTQCSEASQKQQSLEP